jgi:hypothetical protein
LRFNEISKKTLTDGLPQYDEPIDDEWLSVCDGGLVVALLQAIATDFSARTSNSQVW